MKCPIFLFRKKSWTQDGNKKLSRKFIYLFLVKANLYCSNKKKKTDKGYLPSLNEGSKKLLTDKVVYLIILLSSFISLSLSIYEMGTTCIRILITNFFIWKYFLIFRHQKIITKLLLCIIISASYIYAI